VAEALGLSEKTARNYLSQVYEKLGLQRRSQLAALFANRSRASCRQQLVVSVAHQRARRVKTEVTSCLGNLEGLVRCGIPVVFRPPKTARRRAVIHCAV
jgi:hypothetical protein